jgi:hypothetical protein
MLYLLDILIVVDMFNQKKRILFSSLIFFLLSKVGREEDDDLIAARVHPSLIESVEALAALLAHPHQPGIFELLKVMTDGRLVDATFEQLN